MAAKLPNVYGCRVPRGGSRKGCGGGASVVELEDLKERVKKLEAEKKRKKAAGKRLDGRPRSGTR